MAVDLIEARVPHPGELLAEPGETIFRVILHTPDGATKALVLPGMASKRSRARASIGG